MDAANPPVLNYSTPRVLFDRPYRYRSPNGVFGIACMVGACVFLLFLGSKIPARVGFSFLIAGSIAYSLAAASAIGFAWLVYKFARGDADHARVTLEGIESKRQIHPWDAIAAVFGTKMAGGILLQFELRRQGGIALPKHLMTTPLLAPDEFAKLMDDLDAEVRPAHPHVKLDRFPRSSD